MSVVYAVGRYERLCALLRCVSTCAALPSSSPFSPHCTHHASLHTDARIYTSPSWHWQPQWGSPSSTPWRSLSKRSKGKPGISDKALEVKVQHRRVGKQIKAENVRLIDQGANVVIPTAEALALARKRGLDLVEMDHQEVPVCKLMRYSEYYEAQKETKLVQMTASQEVEKAKADVKVKGLRIGCNIAQHDLHNKLKRLKEFLDAGHVVNVSVQYNVRQWREQYQKAVTVAKNVYELYKEDTACWFDWSESGNKQITIMFTHDRKCALIKNTRFPWESGSQPPPFIAKMQQEAAERKRS